MATRAELIVKIANDLGDLRFGISLIDTVGIGNMYYYALNDAISMHTSSDVSNYNNNDIRIVTIGGRYFILKGMLSHFVAVPRLDQDTISRDKFSRVAEMFRLAKEEWENALSGADIPAERQGYASTVVTWTHGDADNFDSTGQSNSPSHSSGDAFISDLGIDSTDYSDNGE